MIIFGETFNISQLCELQWFKWVMFQDKIILYLDDHFKVGSYLGTSIYIGPVMMAKIIKENGQVLHWSMYQELTQDE